MSNIGHNFVIALPRNGIPDITQDKKKCDGIESNEISFTCDYCGNVYFTVKELETHILKHLKNVSKWKCDLCKVSFSRKSYLTEHNLTHSGGKPHVCYYCGKSFSLRCNHIRHVRLHTGEKPYRCDQCDKSFPLKKNRDEHVRTHTGEKPYKCTKCEWSFGRRSSLVRHIRAHTGEKNFQCNICGKKYAWKYYLQRHMSVHLNGTDHSEQVRHKRKNTKPVDYAVNRMKKCDICGQLFRTKKSLNKHTQQHEDYVLVSKNLYLNNSITQEDYEMLTTKKMVVCCEPVSNI